MPAVPPHQLTALPDRPDGVNDPPSRQPETWCGLGITHSAAAELGTSGGKLLLTCSFMDSPIDPTASSESAVGRVHNGVHRERRYATCQGNDGRDHHRSVLNRHRVRPNAQDRRARIPRVPRRRASTAVSPRWILCTLA